VALLVEGTDGTVGQGAEHAEAGLRHLRERIDAAREHHFGLAGADRIDADADRVQAGAAGRRHDERGAAQVVEERELVRYRADEAVEKEPAPGRAAVPPGLP